MHKAGFINILGKPNAGKSTLLNALLGEKLAIITHKAQTTRHRIMGFYNDEGHQLVFSDTPGIIEPAYKLQERMMKGVEESMEDADIYLLVLDATDRRHWEDKLPWLENVEQRLQQPGLPLLVFVNKAEDMDAEQRQAKEQICRERFPLAHILFKSKALRYCSTPLKPFAPNMPLTLTKKKLPIGLYVFSLRNSFAKNYCCITKKKSPTIVP